MRSLEKPLDIKIGMFLFSSYVLIWLSVWAFHKPTTATNMVKMRISDAPYLQIGEKLYCDNKEYTVSQEPLKDTNNLTWSFEVVCT